ncbi:cupin domain-containing protein [Streptomyces sp. SCA3-4]|uniref:cupin domain-containing protein n=1 Tax=Streptomyces sichuanensis TaxID=2871810 RepID=UPI001CE38714|nr:cupin domain-containing protein [Streptomyces sichuanensis]MCA6093724.1 cupin domain-containing protein [Streptomyces sichuanensis]
MSTTPTDAPTGRPDAGPRPATVLRGLLSPEGLDALDWTTWSEPGRAGVEAVRLYTTDGPSPATGLISRMAPGAHGDLHEHLGYEAMFVLQGELCDDSGARYTTGDLIVVEPGSVHQVSTETGCVVLGFRDAPTAPLR